MRLLVDLMPWLVILALLLNYKRTVETFRELLDVLNDTSQEIAAGFIILSIGFSVELVLLGVASIIRAAKGH